MPEKMKAYAPFEGDRVANQMIIGTFGVSVDAFPFLGFLCGSNVEARVIKPLEQLIRPLHDPRQLHQDDGNQFMANAVERVMQPTYDMFSISSAKRSASSSSSPSETSSSQQTSVPCFYTVAYVSVVLLRKSSWKLQRIPPSRKRNENCSCECEYISYRIMH
jgi:hypothetical protein